MRKGPPLVNWWSRNFSCWRRGPRPRLKFAELSFQLPLQSCLFTPIQEPLTPRGSRFCAAKVGSAFPHCDETFRIAPQARAGKKGMLKAGARHVLQLDVGEVLF